MYDLHDYLEPVNISEISNDEAYNNKQIGSSIAMFSGNLPDIENKEVIILGVAEQRGAGLTSSSKAADSIRRQFYKLYQWHSDIEIADLGTIKTGSTLADSYAAIKTVVRELIKMNKKVVLIGGSHDNTLAQYHCYRDLDKMIEATVIDARIDLNNEAKLRSENFLMELLTTEPNQISQYNHIGFQSYFVHPTMLETLDKLRFDCFRVGVVKEAIEEMEPAMRNSHIVSIDISVIKNSDAPANKCSPNGLSGEEACVLTRFAGMSSHLDTIGIYGYQPENDIKDLTAMQISQMLWYFIDGRSRCRQEASLEDKHNFNEFHLRFSDMETTFLQSKRTGRWWMTGPDNKPIPCSNKDYQNATRNQMPERWLRALERE